jgi:hypothetical protein
MNLCAEVSALPPVISEILIISSDDAIKEKFLKMLAGSIKDLNIINRVFTRIYIDNNVELMFLNGVKKNGKTNKRNARRRY